MSPIYAVNHGITYAMVVNGESAASGVDRFEKDLFNLLVMFEQAHIAQILKIYHEKLQLCL